MAKQCAAVLQGIQRSHSKIGGISLHVKLLPLMWLMVKFLAIMVPIRLILLLTGKTRTPYQAYRYRQYRHPVYGEW
jgi:hypothetical protein